MAEIEERLQHFEKHYKALVHGLPMEQLLPTFESKGLLRSPQLQQEIKAAKTDTKKAILLLDSMKNGLRMGEGSTFNIFLEALREYAKEANDAAVKKLADDAYKDLPSPESDPKREQHLSTGISKVYLGVFVTRSAKRGLIAFPIAHVW